MLAQIADGPGVPAHEALHFAGIAMLGLFDLGQVFSVDGGLTSEDGAKGRREDQGDEDRRTQHKEQGQGQEAHELAGDRIPKQEG